MARWFSRRQPDAISEESVVPTDDRNSIFASSDDDEKESLYASSGDAVVDEKTPLKSAADGKADTEVVTDEFSGLPLQDAAILREQVDVPVVKASFFMMYRYATFFDKIILAIALTTSILSGVMRPLMTVVFGNVAQTFTESRRMNSMRLESNYTSEYYNSTYLYYKDSYFNGTNYTAPDDFYLMPQYDYQQRINTLALYFVYIGIAAIFFSYISTFLLMDMGEVLSGRVREEYLRATLRQNIGYFDKLGSGEITTRISADTILVQEAMSDKVGHMLQNLTTFAAAYIIALVRSYKLTLILTSVIAFIFFMVTMFSRKMVKCFRASLEGYSVGGTLAEEVISSVRNVQAFGVQDRLALLYDKYLVITEKWALRAGVTLGALIGTMWFAVYCNYALSFWQGSRYLASGELEVGNVIAVLMSMMMCSFTSSMIAPNIKYVTNGIAAASKIFATIDRPSPIDSSADTGGTLDSFEGNIELKHIRFIYPSRPDVTVLEDFSLRIPAGKTVALVGASGSGKSTIIGLLERFYKPIAGNITLDGHDIRNLNLKWLRRQISLVSQEPVLFSCSIFDNVAYGLIGTKYADASEVEKRKLVVEACTQANAMMFIDKLPEGLDTDVGERGFLLSGGQKQRIAIARAIVSNPKILLLDEATSALDTKSEGVVQDALDKAAKNRTTIVIAHRLSTIKDADLIVVMKNGKIVEQGTHNELLDKKAAYYSLVQAQHIEKSKEEERKALLHKLGDDSEAATGIELNELESEVVVDEADALLARTKTNASARSISSLVIEAKEKPTNHKYGLWELIIAVFRLSKPDHTWMFIGATGAFVNGLGYPITSVFYAKCIAAFQLGRTDPEGMRSIVNEFSGLFFMMSLVEGFAFVVTNGSLAYVAQRLVRRIRYMSLRQMLRQDIAYFDRDENSTGALTSMLSRDAQSVEGLSGATLGQILNCIVNLTTGFLLSITVAPKIAGVSVACVPILVGCGFYRFSVQARFEQMIKKSHGKSAAQACEAAAAIRTVVSLTREGDVCDAYHESLKAQMKISRPATNKSAFLFGLSEGLGFFIMALNFWWGSRFLASGEYSVTQFFITFVSMIMGAQAAGIVFSFAPDMGKARSAAENIKRLMDSIPEVDAWNEEGTVLENVEGVVEFKDVHFRYPTRPQVPVLKGLNITVKKGQYAALVGMSGCGKSTTIALIESFYRPLAGQVMLDGHDISTLELSSYRSHIAMVQQEPVLYAGSIRDNVKLGHPQPEEVSDEDVIAVCKQANIHSFVESLPEAYDTLCGSKGILLSGGQKQRIAIARALIRKPKVLLLDEATSALDSESEKIVQASLDVAAKGRTTIAVAHRLSTIQNADVIYVFDAGVVCEQGTHQELLALKGRYFELVQMQALERTA
ncbi:P-loop containing nucleoside triphosphate hydrolase protein [Limtongia smithiae]|uniref:P-loop containing nucleoside triphosphate hydrolase protein n=1 Tax=Limtongia smithiae TaxID=1125753 RepID=UPI0034CF36E2